MAAEKGRFGGVPLERGTTHIISQRRQGPHFILGLFERMELGLGL